MAVFFSTEVVAAEKYSHGSLNQIIFMKSLYLLLSSLLSKAFVQIIKRRFHSYDPSTTVPQCPSATMPQCNSPTVSQCPIATIQQCHSAATSVSIVLVFPATTKSVEGFVAEDQMDVFCADATDNVNVAVTCDKFAYPRKRLQLQIISAIAGTSQDASKICPARPDQICYDFNVTVTNEMKQK